ncbi:GM23906 [Drosophila sechellia]|uniref:GM23906 n=1 Tax=Drosophila sechellia TaxID=7238 RepID=B4IMX6_DROSE|nr:GM23906 [Drosophila sechellia]
MVQRLTLRRRLSYNTRSNKRRMALEFISQPMMATDEAIRALFDQAQRPHYVQSAASEVASADNQQLDKTQ